MLEIVSGSARVWRSNSYVSRSSNFDGNGMVAFILYSSKYPECSQRFVFRQCFYEFYGMLLRQPANFRRLRISLHSWRIEP